MSILTIRVFSTQAKANDAKNELIVAGFDVDGPAEYDTVSWDANDAGGIADAVAPAWVVIAKQA